jgi:prepilin-type N-terminal cleavage/methylation domain-containing protein
MKALFRQNSGLTLPEVLLSAVIIAVAVLALVGLFPTALQNVQYGGHMSQALSLGQEMVELIRTQPFLTVDKYNGLDTRTAPGPLPPAVQGHYDQWKADITPANPAGALPQGWGTIDVETVPTLSDLYKVTITVGWRERGSQWITLVTYVAQYA